MAYIITINEKELNRIRDKEQLVLFLKEKQEYIVKDTDVFFAIPYKEIHRIVGQAKVKNYLEMDKDKLRQIIEDTKNGKMVYESKETLDLSNPLDMNNHSEEMELFSYLQNGYDEWKKKNKKKSLMDYLIEIGYADSKEKIYIHDIPWYDAVMIEDIDVYEQQLPLYFFSDVAKAREEYLKVVNYCNDYMKMKCWQCEYVRYCMEDNIRLRNHALTKLEKQWTETLYIYATVSGLKPIDLKLKEEIKMTN